MKEASKSELTVRPCRWLLTIAEAVRSNGSERTNKLLVRAVEGATSQKVKKHSTTKSETQEEEEEDEEFVVVAVDGLATGRSGR